jgi:hypothetical protein
MRTHQKQLRKELQAASADTEWIVPLIDFLSGTAQAIRIFRNDFGHPTGVMASQSDALPLFSLFPKFAEAATSATNALPRSRQCLAAANAFGMPTRVYVRVVAVS